MTDPRLLRLVGREVRVYFIQIGINGPIKIGIAADPESRLRTLQTACPFELKMRGHVVGSQLDETLLHKRFAKFRLRGEWFEPHFDLENFIDAALAIDSLDDAEIAEHLAWIEEGVRATREAVN